jgi:hypothetical protein
MTLTLARELERFGVTVNAVAPRARTRMTETLGGGFLDSGPEGRFDDLHPDNVAPVVGWLASESARDVSGQVFVVTGGRVHLIEGYREASGITQDKRWTVDELVAAEGRLFGERRRGNPGFGIGF